MRVFTRPGITGWDQAGVTAHQVGKGGHLTGEVPGAHPMKGARLNAVTEFREDSELLGKLEQMRHCFKISLQDLGPMGVLFAVFLGLSALSRVV